MAAIGLELSQVNDEYLSCVDAPYVVMKPGPIQTVG